MSRVPVRLALMVLTGVFLTSAPPALAEPYLAGFAGAAITEDKDLGVMLNLTTGLNTLSAEGKLKGLEFDTSVLFGAKAGYFFNGFLGGSFGLEAEGYHFRPDLDDQIVTFSGTVQGVPTTAQVNVRGDLEATGIGLNLLYRFQLARSPAAPRGRVQPYLGLGVGALIAKLELHSVVLDGRPTADDTDVRPALHVIAGARVHLTEHVALFTEYKFIHTGEFEFNLKQTGTLSGTPATESFRVRTRLTGHHLYAGVGFHW